MKRNDKSTTADLALQWTFREERTPSMLRYRDWIKRASRFVVDNAMLEMMVKHSTNINKLDERIWLSRLPHEITWIEWDCHAHVAAQAAYSRMFDSNIEYDKIPRRKGFLFVRDPARDTRFTMYVFSEDPFEPSGFIRHPICYFVDSEEKIDFDYSCYGARTLEKSLLVNINEEVRPHIKHVLQGELSELTQGLCLGLTGRAFDKAEYFADISDGGGIVKSRWAEEFKKQPFYGKVRAGIVDEFIARMRLSKAETIVEVMIENLKEESGLMRQMVTLLAMINSVPTIIKQVEPSGYRPIGMNKVRYMSHSTITLALPKSRPALFIERSMRNALGDYTKRRAHPVRTYWWEKRDSGKRYCPHSFDHIEKNKYECAHCGRVGWWIKEHVRGDASKGWVRQEYKVVAA